jgi:sec-independent protein translocase protein TatC
MVTDDAANMTVVEHLTELRRRLIISVVAIVLAAILGFVLSDGAIVLLRAPLPDQYDTLFFTSPTGAFTAHLKIALYIGVALAMPIILFEAWRFVTPGLTRRERRVVWPVVIGATFLFVLGLVVGYLILPFALGFLLSFARDDFRPLLTIDDYIGFVSAMLLAFGLVMEFPIVLIGLSRVGVLTYRAVARRRRSIIVGIVAFSTIVTPGGDIFSPLIMSAVMYVLFEASMFIMRRIRP